MSNTPNINTFEQLNNDYASMLKEQDELISAITGRVERLMEFPAEKNPEKDRMNGDFGRGHFARMRDNLEWLAKNNQGLRTIKAHLTELVGGTFEGTMDQFNATGLRK